MDALLIATVITVSAAGAMAGTFTGLIPGIHVNTLASIMLMGYPSISSMMGHFADPVWVPILVSSCIMSASVVHSFVDFVPSVFTGAPDQDDILSVLPGHRLLLSGEGMSAVRSAAIGSAIGSGCALALAIPVQYLMINGLSEKLDSLTLPVLLFALSIMLINEKGHRALALVLILLSGTLGYMCTNFNLPCDGLLGAGTLLFPLLTGLFGMPALLMSTKSGKVPNQRDEKINPVNSMPGIKGVVTGCLAGWYPGITSTAGASMASAITPENEPERFISLVASIGTVTTVFSIVTLSVSGSGRSGTVLVIKEIIGDGISGYCSSTFLMLLLSVAIAAVIGYHMTIAAGRLMSKISLGSDLRLLNKIILLFTVTLVLLLTGPFGLAILLTSTTIGFIPVKTNMGRIPLTGCLIVPAMIAGTSAVNSLTSIIGLIILL